MNAIPVWFLIAVYSVQMLTAIGAVVFTLAVLWPSIRKSNRAAERICTLVDRLERKGVDDWVDRL